MKTAEWRVVLGSKRFRELLAVRLVGQFCDGLFQASLSSFILFSPERQSDALGIALAFALIYIPYTFVGPFVGVFLDRWRRRQVLLYGNIVRGLIVLYIAWLTSNGSDGITLGIAVLIALGINRFVLAGLSASLPHTVDKKVLVTANAYSPTAGTIFAAIGGVIGFAVLRALGGGDAASTTLLVACAIIFAVSGLLALRMPKNLLGPDESEPRDSVASVVRGLIDGSKALTSHKPAFHAVTVTALHRVALGAATLTGIMIIRNTLNAPADATGVINQIGLVLAAAGLGALVGAVCSPSMVARFGAVRWTAATFIFAGIVTGIGLAIHSMASLMVAGVAIGLVGQVAKICADTAVQSDLSDEYRGRVFTLYDIAVNLGLTVGVALVALTLPPSGISMFTCAAIGVFLVVVGLTYGRTSDKAQTVRQVQ